MDAAERAAITAAFERDPHGMKCLSLLIHYVGQCAVDGIGGELTVEFEDGRIAGYRYCLTAGDLATSETRVRFD